MPNIAYKKRAILCLARYTFTLDMKMAKRQVKKLNNYIEERIL